jgi:hypothetical protein
MHKYTEELITLPGAEGNASPSEEVSLGRIDHCITVDLHSRASAD